jgi:hypothetical protein
MLDEYINLDKRKCWRLNKLPKGQKLANTIIHHGHPHRQVTEWYEEKDESSNRHRRPKLQARRRSPGGLLCSHS